MDYKIVVIHKERIKKSSPEILEEIHFALGEQKILVQRDFRTAYYCFPEE